MYKRDWHFCSFFWVENLRVLQIFLQHLKILHILLHITSYWASVLQKHKSGQTRRNWYKRGCLANDQFVLLLLNSCSLWQNWCFFSTEELFYFIKGVVGKNEHICQNIEHRLDKKLSPNALVVDFLHWYVFFWKGCRRIARMKELFDFILECNCCDKDIKKWILTQQLLYKAATRSNCSLQWKEQECPTQKKKKKKNIAQLLKSLKKSLTNPFDWHEYLGT